MSKWPALDRDFEILKTELDSKRGEISKSASRSKRWFFYSQWFVVLAGVGLVGLGAALATLDEENPTLALIQIILSFAVGAIVLINQEMNWQKRWLHQRARSEALKREYYLFLGRVGAYGEADEEGRVHLLRDRIWEVEKQFDRALTGQE